MERTLAKRTEVDLRGDGKASEWIAVQDVRSGVVDDDIWPHLAEGSLRVLLYLL